MADLNIQDHGSIFLVQPLTDAGRVWMSDNLPENSMTFCGGTVIEHRYIAEITAGAIEDGLEVT